jgi:hypothetical protein
VWAFEVSHPSGIKIQGLIGIHPNYPMSAAQFRLKAPEPFAVAEADIREMESEVNVFGNRFLLKTQKSKTPSHASRAPALMVRNGNGVRAMFEKNKGGGDGGGGSVGGANGMHGCVGGTGGELEDDGGGGGEICCLRGGEDYDAFDDTFEVGSKANKIPDHMMLSMQILKLLVCVDTVATAMSERKADDDAEEVPTVLMNIDSTAGANRDKPEQSKVGAVEIKSTRVTRGRSRSKPYKL